MDLTVLVYEASSSFPPQERYGLTSQLRRASVGVVSQIAEGQGRLTFGEWRQFLSQARGSLFEVEAELLVAERLGFLKGEALTSLNVAIKRTGKALIGLIRWVQKQEQAGKKPRNLGTTQPRNPV